MKCFRPVAGTSMMCAEVMTAGPPGVASRLSSASASHFCVSWVCASTRASCAASAGPLRPTNARKAIHPTMDKLQARRRCKPSLKMMTLHLVPPDLLSHRNRPGYQAASISVPSTRSSRRRQYFQFPCTSQLVDKGRVSGSVPSFRPECATP